MKTSEFQAIGSVDEMIKIDRESAGKAFTKVLNLLMQCISICVATRDPETLATLDHEVSILFRDAHLMLTERTAADIAGLN